MSSLSKLLCATVALLVLASVEPIRMLFRLQKEDLRLSGRLQSVNYASQFVANYELRVMASFLNIEQCDDVVKHPVTSMITN
eukprot:IDg14080t1